jgi:hypothetical protein
VILFFLFRLMLRLQIAVQMRYVLLCDLFLHFSALLGR